MSRKLSRGRIGLAQSAPTATIEDRFQLPVTNSVAALAQIPAQYAVAGNLDKCFLIGGTNEDYIVQYTSSGWVLKDNPIRNRTKYELKNNLNRAFNDDIYWNKSTNRWINAALTTGTAVDEVEDTEEEKLAALIPEVPGAYNSASTTGYAIGAQVFQDGELVIANTASAIPPGPFVAAHWTEVGKGGKAVSLKLDGATLAYDEVSYLSNIGAYSLPSPIDNTQTIEALIPPNASVTIAGVAYANASTTESEGIRLYNSGTGWVREAEGAAADDQPFYIAAVQDVLLTPPPSGLTAGDRYLVADDSGAIPAEVATGAWLGRDGEIAIWGGAAWTFENKSLYTRDQVVQVADSNHIWYYWQSSQSFAKTNSDQLSTNPLRFIEKICILCDGDVTTYQSEITDWVFYDYNGNAYPAGVWQQTNTPSLEYNAVGTFIFKYADGASANGLSRVEFSATFASQRSITLAFLNGEPSYTDVNRNATSPHILGTPQRFLSQQAVASVLGQYRGSFDTALSYAADDMVLASDGRLYVANDTIPASATEPQDNLGTTGSTWSAGAETRGVYAGQSATYLALPTTRQDASVLQVGDWAQLTADDGTSTAGLFEWDGAAWQPGLQTLDPSQILLSGNIWDNTIWQLTPTPGNAQEAVDAIKKIVEPVYKTPTTGATLEAGHYYKATDETYNTPANPNDGDWFVIFNESSLVPAPAGDLSRITLVGPLQTPDGIDIPGFSIGPNYRFRIIYDGAISRWKAAVATELSVTLSNIDSGLELRAGVHYLISGTSAGMRFRTPSYPVGNITVELVNGSTFPVTIEQFDTGASDQFRFEDNLVNTSFLLPVARIGQPVELSGLPSVNRWAIRRPWIVNAERWIDLPATGIAIGTQVFVTADATFEAITSTSDFIRRDTFIRNTAATAATITGPTFGGAILQFKQVDGTLSDTYTIEPSAVAGFTLIDDGGTNVLWELNQGGDSVVNTIQFPVGDFTATPRNDSGQGNDGVQLYIPASPSAVVTLPPLSSMAPASGIGKVIVSFDWEARTAFQQANPATVLYIADTLASPDTITNPQGFPSEGSEAITFVADVTGATNGGTPTWLVISEGSVDLNFDLPQFTDLTDAGASAAPLFIGDGTGDLGTGLYYRNANNQITLVT